MKPTLILVFALIISSFAYSQVPQKFKYQGIARKSNGNVVDSADISLRISIHQGSAGGTIVYKETQTATTNHFGAFNINVGAGSVVSGNFSTIPWGRYPYFQEVEMDITGGVTYVSMGTSQLLSVPYALAADSAVHVIAPLILINTRNIDSGIALYASNVSTNAPTIAAENTGDGSAISGNNNSNTKPTMEIENHGSGLAAKFFGGVEMSLGSVLVSGGTFTSNGNAFLNNNVNIGGTLTGTIISGTSGSFSNAITAGGATINGNAHITGDLQIDGGAGTINANIINGTQGSFSVGLTASDATINGNVHITGTTQFDGNVGPLNASIVNGTQGNFSTSVTTPSLIVNGSGHVTGGLQVDGNLSKGGGSFKIDHPLDPANKFLYHSFVESPDMKNIYDGNVITDERGEAIVELPKYFEALNKDFRYQLTVIGQFAQAIVATEIKDNKFKIRSDKPNVKISWQVTGIRKDAYAEKNRILPEVEKNSDEKGRYLYPEALGFGKELKITK